MPEIPRLGPGRVVPIQRVQPLDVGSGAGDRAYGGAADTLSLVSAQVAQAESTARTDRSLAEAYSAITERVSAYEQDPDYQTIGERFQKDREGILKQYRSGLSTLSARDFETRIQPVLSRAEFALRDHVTKRGIAAAQGHFAETSRLLSDLAGRAKSPEEREAIRRQFAEVSGRAEAHQILSPVQGVAAREGFDQTIARGDLRERLRSDPAGTLQTLRDPSDPFTALFTEEERQVAIDQGVSAVKAREAEARARQREARAALVESRDAALQDGIDLLDTNELTADWIFENSEVLGSKNRLRLRKLLGDGTKAADPVELNRLNRLAVDDPAAFGAEDIDPVKLGTSYKTMLTLQRNVRESGFLDSQTQSLMQRVNARATSLSLDDTETVEFDRRVNEEIEEFVKRNGGKRPDRAQQDSIVDGLTLEVRGSKGFDWAGFAVSRGRIDLEGEAINGVPGPFVEMLVDDLEDQGKRITTDVLFGNFTTIANDLKANGLPVTEPNIARWLGIARQQRSKP